MFRELVTKEIELKLLEPYNSSPFPWDEPVFQATSRILSTPVRCSSIWLNQDFLFISQNAN